jgi:hypothetical protein
MASQWNTKKRMLMYCHLQIQYIIQSPNFLTFKEPKNLFQGSNSARLCRLAGRYDNPMPTRFLSPIDCLKISALSSNEQYRTAFSHIQSDTVPRKLSVRQWHTEDAGSRELAQHGGEWPGRCGLYCDGRSIPTARTNRTTCPSRCCSIARFGNYCCCCCCYITNIYNRPSSHHKAGRFTTLQ